MEYVNTLLAGLAVSQLLFWASYNVSRVGRNYLARLLVLFALCLSAFLLGDMPFIAAIGSLDFLLSRLAILTPAVLWLFSVAFFKDEQRIPSWGLGLIALYFLLSTTNSLLALSGVDTGEPGYYLGYLLPLFLMFGLSVHVVYMGIEGRRDDLLEERRRLRIPFVISMGVVILFTLAFIALSPLLQSLMPEGYGQPFVSTVTMVIYGSIFFWTLVLNLAIFRLNTDAERLLQDPQPIGFISDRDEEAEKTTAREARLLQKINVAMDDQKLYRQNDFTIVRLGEQLATPEQRLRTAINSTMGFRNFNQFLNHYRVGEAARLLTESDEPIANIAMSVGYNSLSVFNKAFKEIHQKTPREFRVQH
jgi:AraC-like DNA-binding protein